MPDPGGDPQTVSELVAELRALSVVADENGLPNATRIAWSGADALERCAAEQARLEAFIASQRLSEKCAYWVEPLSSAPPEEPA